MIDAVLGLLLRLYPAAFRRRFGREIRAQALEDCDRSLDRGDWQGRFDVAVTLADVGVAGIRERLHPTWFGAGTMDESEGRLRMRIDDWIRDFRYAGRALRRAPGFTGAAALTLGLALGVNAAIFGLVDQVLLEPLPVPDPDRLVVIQASAPGSDFPDEFGVSREFYVQYAEEADLLKGVATVNGFTATLRVGERVERVSMSWPTHEFFEVLGVEPVIGRWPTPEDGEEVMILSHSTWVNWFGADPNVLGQAHFAINGPKEIIGVMPPDFGFPSDQTTLWVSNVITADEVQPGRFGETLIARMTEDADHASLVNQLSVLAARLPERFGGSPAYARLIEQHVPVVRSATDFLVGPVETALWVLMSAVGLVLLIACANVANLFSVRAETRSRSLAVRRAIGAGRAQLVRTQMAEASLVAILAGILALGLAAVALPALVRVAPEQLPRIGGATLDTSTLAYTLGATIFATLVCGLWPAWRASRPRLSRLREGGRGSTRGRHWGRDGLVVAQTALALVLLIGSGLLLRSFRAMTQVDAGYTTEDIFTFQFAPEQEHLTDGPAWAQFHMAFMDRLRALPGVDAVGIVENVPLDEGTSGTRLATPEMVDDPDNGVPGNFTFTGGDYFQAMDIALLRGRVFDASDLEGTANVVISETAAERLFGEQDPLGRTVRMANAEEWFTVVGVVEDVLQSDFRTEPQALLYFPLTGPAPDMWALSSPGYVVRTSRGEGITADVRALVREVAPEAPMYRTYTMAALAERSMLELSFTMMTLLVAAGLALLLGAVGLYGVLSYVVAERAQEIGVRMALGAEAARVRRMVVVQGTRVVIIGVALGLVVAWFAVRALSGLIFGVPAVDVATFGGMSALMVAIGAVASWIPATRASSVDPITSMRA